MAQTVVLVDTALNRRIARLAAREARQRNRALVLAAKAGSCVDCGRTDESSRMHLDHVRGRKLFNLSDAGSRAEDAVRAELAKCELRCPRCHSHRHHKVAS